MEPTDTQLPATITQAEIIAPSAAHMSLVDQALIADLGDDASWRYVEFFTANIRNPNTRRAYARACSQFFGWCENRGLALAEIRPFDVAAYIEGLQQQHSAPGVKQQLAAIRMLFDWLITGQVLPTNPAAAVRGPKHVVKTGKTPVLEAPEWRTLLNSIPGTTLRDLRDRALIATLTYGFARINAALRMPVEDLRPRGVAGIGCMRKAARSTRCRAIKRSPRLCAPISRRQGSPMIGKAGCSAPRAGITAIRYPTSR